LKRLVTAGNIPLVQALGVLFWVRQWVWQRSNQSSGKHFDRMLTIKGTIELSWDSYPYGKQGYAVLNNASGVVKAETRTPVAVRALSSASRRLHPLLRVSQYR
jgi:hypothetical protein